ncbi:TonB family protein [Burkholderia oklahomensis]|uniref:TonB family protein n=1 Tax=Burkholderia oklahomensis TaxID=342113 RepID=UPI00264D2C44|nr:TonB family protein [Burkholderia oklahomensis]MDN7673354.1 TonB family protein [Burkholderia oklahomensis]
MTISVQTAFLADVARPHEAAASFAAAPVPARRGVHAGAAVSLALHGAALAALWAFQAHAPLPPARERAIELTITQPAPVRTLVAPPPVQAPAPREQASEPMKRAAPPPVRRSEPARPAATHAAEPAARPVPIASARAAPAASPVVQPAPAAVQAAPIAPASSAASAPAAAPPKPQVVGMPGIPSDYVSKVLERIDRHAADSYPRAARLRREEGRVGYRLTLDPDGRLLRVDIVPSGNDDLDSAARDAIRAAAPFPKPPDLGASAYQLAGAIVYQLTD